MPKLRFDRLLLLVLAVFLAKPFWNWFQHFNYEVWRAVRGIVVFFETNPLVTLLLVGLILFLFTKRAR